MFDKLNIGVRQGINLYIVVWLLIAIVIILFLSLSKINDEIIVCLDGTETYDAAECPQCIDDSQCTLDQYCNFGKCSAKACEIYSDCVVPGNDCIFGQCRYLSGDQGLVIEDEPIIEEEE